MLDFAYCTNLVLFLGTINFSLLFLAFIVILDFKLVADFLYEIVKFMY